MRIHSSIIKVMFIATTSFLLISCGDEFEKPDRDTPIGRTHKTYFDENRSSWVDDGKRPLSTTIWYPATDGTVEEEWKIDIFKLGYNAPDAYIARSPEKLPLIVLSHGTGGSAIHFSWLAEKLASNGYMVASVNHHGNTAGEDEYLPQGFSLWWERARDISALIDNLIIDPDLASRIDQDRMAAGGFSLGGYTSIALAGGQIDFKRYGMFCDEHPNNPICVMPPEAPFTTDDARAVISSDPELVKSLENAGAYYGDPRLKAIYSMAPVMGPAFTPESLAAVTKPVKIVVGTEDDQAIPEYNAEVIAAGIPGAELLVIPDVTHYTFLARCTFFGELVASEICKDADSINRGTFHNEIGEDALQFFNTHVK